MTTDRPFTFYRQYKTLTMLFAVVAVLCGLIVAPSNATGFKGGFPSKSFDGFKGFPDPPAVPDPPKAPKPPKGPKGKKPRKGPKKTKVKSKTGEWLMCGYLAVVVKL